MGKAKTSIYFKMIASVVIVTFVAYDITWAQGVASPAWEYAKPSLEITADQEKITGIDIPLKSGETEETHTAGHGRLIINIKDNHASLSAQYSIVDILESLATNYDLSLLAVEGSEGYIDTSILKTFPDKEIKKRTAGYLMEEGKMSAGEFFSIVSDKDIALYGIEDDELYRKNIESFKSIIAERAKCLEGIEALERELKEIGKVVYNKPLRMFNYKSARHREGVLSFSRYWDYISALAKEKPLLDSSVIPDLSVIPAKLVPDSDRGAGIHEKPAYKNIEKVILSAKLEKTINFREANAERKALIDVLSGRLTRERIERLVLESIAFKKGEISRGAFHRYLVDLAREERIDSAPYENLIKFTRYITVYERVDLARLSQEVEALEEKTREALFLTEEERALYDLDEKTRLLKGLFKVELDNKSLAHLTA
ncbi:MAG: hypothetical protein KKG95_05025, partial [Candidatus Omnitrophica bacterium]|nr:hypothetical protein [Candidatus Omnitrophota bacterium]